MAGGKAAHARRRARLRRAREWPVTIFHDGRDGEGELSPCSQGQRPANNQPPPAIHTNNPSIRLNKKKQRILGIPMCL